MNFDEEKEIREVINSHDANLGFLLLCGLLLSLIVCGLVYWTRAELIEVKSRLDSLEQRAKEKADGK